ncbi:MAG: hypothetical protein Q9181_001997 [Wetmoreana brouardii]
MVNRANMLLATSVAVKSGQKRGCDRCKATSGTCVYSITRDDGRAKRRRRTDNANTSKNKHEDGTRSTPTLQGTKSSATTGDASGRERKSTDDTALLAQSQQELQRSTEIFGGSDGQASNNSVPPQQDGLLQKLENDFDLLDGNVFDISPNLNLHTAKIFSDASGADLDHDLDFVPKPAYGNRHVSTAPSAQMSDVQLSRNMSRDDNDYDMWSPSSNFEFSNPEKAINRQTSHNPATKAAACNCLVIKVSLLEELGSHKVDTSLNEGLATHKGCLMKCSSVLDCQNCMSKSESVMLLVLVYERLVSFCETVTDTYLKRQTHVRSGISSPDPERPRLAVGKYSIDKDGEWDCLLGALTLYQVKTLGKQLLAMRKPASIVLRGSKLSKLLACERKMRALVELLQSQ